MSEKLEDPNQRVEQARLNLQRVPPEYLVWFSRFQNGYTPVEGQLFKYAEAYCKTPYDRFLFEKVGNPFRDKNQDGAPTYPRIERDGVTFDVPERSIYSNDGNIFVTRSSTEVPGKFYAASVHLRTGEAREWWPVEEKTNDILSKFLELPTHEDLFLTDVRPTEHLSVVPSTAPRLRRLTHRPDMWFVQSDARGNEIETFLKPLSELACRVNNPEAEMWAYVRYVELGRKLGRAAVFDEQEEIREEVPAAHAGHQQNNGYKAPYWQAAQ